MRPPTVIDLLAPLTRRPSPAGGATAPSPAAQTVAPVPAAPAPIPPAVQRALAAFGERVLRELEPAGPGGLPVFELVDRTGFDLDVVLSALEWLREQGRAEQLQADPKHGNHVWRATS